MRRLKNSIREHPDFSNHEELISLFPPKEFGVSEVLIVIHNGRLGPATGGTRVLPYASREEAETDGLRLSGGMTRKIVLADEIGDLSFDVNGQRVRGLGGGKAIVIGRPEKITERFLEWYAEKLNTFGGKFVTGEDMNFGMRCVDYMYRYTPYVAGRSEHLGGGGDPSIMTAEGVLDGIKACLTFLDGNDSLAGKTFALMGGGGKVGKAVSRQLLAGGASLIASELPEKVKFLQEAFGEQVRIVLPAAIFSQECDGFVPCAQGGILETQRNIPQLKCRFVAGSANNQLKGATSGRTLFGRKILYAPDCLINAGGLINIAVELSVDGYDCKRARNMTSKIGPRLLNIFEESRKRNLPEFQIAEALYQRKKRKRLAQPGNIGL